MKVLLLQQEMGRRQKEKPVFPLGLAYLAAALKEKNHTVKIFDPNIYRIEEASRQLKYALEAFLPQAVGISIKYIETIQKSDAYIYYKNIRKMVDLVKEISPKTTIIAGGTGFSIFAKEIMYDLPAVDFGVYLEGEDTLLELIDNLDCPARVKGAFIRSDGKVHFTGNRNLPDFSNFPMFATDSQIWNISKYITNDYQIFGIQSKRGCSHECAYCSYPILNGRALRLKNPVKVVDEIELLAKQYGLTAFSFADNIFNVPRQHSKDICLEMIKRDLHVEWGAWFDLKNFSEELSSLAVKAGCRYAEFSPDCATEEGLKFFRKEIHVEDIMRSIEIAKKEKKLIVSYNFFCIHPKQNFRRILKTFALFAKILFSLFGRARISLAWIRIMPGTSIQQIAIIEGIIKKRQNLLVCDEKDLNRVFYSKPSLRYVEVFFTYLVIAGDRFLKPVLRWMFKLTGKFYPFYYQ